MRKSPSTFGNYFYTIRTIVIDADPGTSPLIGVPVCIVTVAFVPVNCNLNISPALILIINSLTQIWFVDVEKKACVWALPITERPLISPLTAARAEAVVEPILKLYDIKYLPVAGQVNSPVRAAYVHPSSSGAPVNNTG